MSSQVASRALGDGGAPRVSVIIATYNWSSVLRFAVQSVLWQRFQDFEVLVVGDGCTDDSATVVASLGDRRVHWHNLPVNSGSQSAPNNSGLALARGEYVAYLGHDDLWHPEHLGSLVATLDDSPADLAHSLASLIGPPGTGARILTGVAPVRGDGRPLFVPPSSILHRRDLVRRIGPWADYRELTMTPDAEFQQRAWSARPGFACSGVLSVFKFPASWRPNSYRARRCEEQAAFAARIQQDPAFLLDELLAIARAYAVRTTEADWEGGTRSIRPGWIVELNRWIRGLEDEPPPAALEELLRLRDRERELVELVEERTSWAQNLDREIATRDALIRQLQAELAEQGAWGQRSAAAVEERDALIRDLQARLSERTEWALQLDRELAARELLVQELEARLRQ